MTNPLIFASNSFYFFRVKNILLYEKIKGVTVMLLYVIRRAIWEYRMYAYGYQIRRLNNMIITMEMKHEKEMKKFERFKRTTKSNRSKMARYINTTR